MHRLLQTALHAVFLALAANSKVDEESYHGHL